MQSISWSLFSQLSNAPMRPFVFSTDAITVVDYDRRFHCIGDGLFMVEGAARSAICDVITGNVFSINYSLSEAVKIAISEPSLREKIRAYIQNIDQGMGDRVFVASTGVSLFPPPVDLEFVWFEIVSDTCNLRCTHCYADSGINSAVGPQKENRPYVSHKQWRDLIQQAYQLGATRCQFIGGEPLLYRRPEGDLCDLLSLARSVGYSNIEIFTNATNTQVLDRDVIAECVSEAKVSIYSSDPRVHDAITGIVGSHQKTLSGIKFFLNAGIAVSVHIIVQSTNEHTLDETLEFCMKLGVDNVRAEPLRPAGRGRIKGSPPSHDYIATAYLTEPAFNCTANMVPRWGYANSCLAGSLAITECGDVLPCVFQRDRSCGNVLSQSLKDIVSSEAIEYYWKLGKNSVAVCKNCEFRYVCFDCRPLSAAISNQARYVNAPPARCTYDPTTGVWGPADPRRERWQLPILNKAVSNPKRNMG